jgi:putative DNA methylase
VLINKAMIEIPPKFAGMPPVNPDWQRRSKEEKSLKIWKGAQGLAEDVRYYGKWMRDEAEKRIGHLYPKVEVTEEMLGYRKDIEPLIGKEATITEAMAKDRADLEPLVGKEVLITEQMSMDRPDLKPYVGRKLTVIAWLWARTVKSPNPAFAHVDVPLASTFMLSTKKGKEAYVEPVIEDGGYRFTVKVGKPKDLEAVKNGTKLSRGANFRCLMSGTPIQANYIRVEAQAGRMGARLMAIVAEGTKGRVYLPPTEFHDEIPRTAVPSWKPELKVPTPCHDVDRLPMYGMPTWGDAFTPRQLVALTTFSDLVGEAMELVKLDALDAGLPNEGYALHDGGTGAQAYGEAVGVYLAFAISKMTNIGSSIASWMSDRGAFRETFARQAIPMVWDFAEANTFADTGGSFAIAVEKGAMAVSTFPSITLAMATQVDAASQTVSIDKAVSTDPPYYDNIGYADLSDFFYVWLRHSLQPIFPDLFATLAVPKAEELVATPYRHGSREKAEAFFLGGMTQAMHRLAEQAHPGFPVTIYYAFKQAESDRFNGTASTGWDTFLAAVIEAGFAISGTWPMRTEGSGRMIAMGTNALASSIVLVCRKCPADAPVATRREFLTALKTELPKALVLLQRGNIAPVDLAQAAIGPGMAVYTRYSKVLDAEGKPLTVREALALINQTLDEALAEQEGDFDADSRWALAWFEQMGFGEGEYGVAEILSKAKNTSVDGMVAAGIVVSGRGKVRLLKPEELPADWDPEKDPRLTAWEMVHQLIRALEARDEGAASDLVAKLGTKAETARELCYRLYTLCERKKRAAEALSYNALVQSWPEIVRLARLEEKPPASVEGDLFDS